MGTAAWDAKGASGRGRRSHPWPVWLPPARAVLGDVGFLCAFAVYPLWGMNDKHFLNLTHYGVFGICLFLYGSCDSPSARGQGFFASFLRAPAPLP